MQEILGEKVLTPLEFAQVFGIHPHTVRKMIKRGQIPAMKLGKRHKIMLIKFLEQTKYQMKSSQSIEEMLSKVEAKLASNNFEIATKKVGL